MEFIKYLFLFFSLNLTSQNLSNEGIFNSVFNGVTYTCFDSLAVDRVIDSTLKLKELREILVVKNIAINSLISEFNECQNNIIGYKLAVNDYAKIDSLRQDNESILTNHIIKLQKQNKRTKFTHKFFGTLSIVGAGVGGYLIGKKL